MMLTFDLENLNVLLVHLLNPLWNVGHVAEAAAGVAVVVAQVLVARADVPQKLEGKLGNGVRCPEEVFLLC